MASTTSAPPPGTESDWGATGGGGGGLQHGRPAPVSTFPAAVRPSQTGIGVALAAISMMFAALTSAMVVRQGAARDWGHFELPGILYFNTLILLLSSFSLELARRRFAQDPGLGREESHGNAGQSAQVLYWLYATMGLGLLFVFGQLVAWRELAAQGLFLATTPSTSFFYVLTAVHGLHLLGGITGLAYALHRMSRSTGSRPNTALGVAVVYWHFMDGLWVYLLLLMMTRMNVT